MDETQALQAYINALAAVAAAASAALATPGLSRQQAAAERQALTYAQAAMLLAAQDLRPDVTPATILVQPGDTLFSLAQDRLGDATKYKLIMQAQQPPLVGIHIDPGQVLILPSAQ